MVFGGSDSTVQFAHGLNRPEKELRRIFPFNTYGHKPLKKFHLTTWIIFIHNIQQSWYIQFLLLVLQTAMNTVLRTRIP
jgi:hypothetical protein